MSSAPLLSVQDLHVVYEGRRGRKVHAVQGVSFDIEYGQTIGLVGESGSGKSTIGKAVLGLAPTSAGRVLLDGKDLRTLSGAERRQLSRQLQVIFQDPYGSLNPARTIGRTLAEPLRVQGDHDDAAIRRRMGEVLEQVGMPANTVERYPSEFSGGQRQRIAIARSLMTRPKLIICDEPVSALDLSIQAQVLNLLNDLKRELDMSYLFISHDLFVVRYMAEQMLVLNKGLVVERGAVDDVYRNPKDEYTQRLLAATPGQALFSEVA